MSNFVPLEVASRATPVGIRFWDDLTRSFVTDGLDVTVQPANVALPPTALVANRSGVYYAQRIPFFPSGGLGAAGDDAYWASIKANAQPFVVRVDDPTGRFLPFSFPAQLPAQGLVGWTCAAYTSSLSGNPLPPGVPLFSSPARVPGGAFAVIRATLWDANANAPAAFAALEITLDGTLPHAWGVADAGGRVAVYFAYPELPAPPTDGTGLVPLSQQTWTLPVTVHYKAGTFAASATYPDRCTILDQGAGTLWSDKLQSTPITTVPITYGVETILRSTPAASVPKSVLLVTSA